MMLEMVQADSSSRMPHGPTLEFEIRDSICAPSLSAVGLEGCWQHSLRLDLSLALGQSFRLHERHDEWQTMQQPLAAQLLLMHIKFSGQN